MLLMSDSLIKPHFPCYRHYPMAGISNLINFNFEYIGVDFALKVINWDSDTLIRLQLWDIAGRPVVD